MYVCMYVRMYVYTRIYMQRCVPAAVAAEARGGGAPCRVRRAFEGAWDRVPPALRASHVPGAGVEGGLGPVDPSFRALSRHGPTS